MSFSSITLSKLSRLTALLVAISLMLSGCASLKLQSPQVSLISISPSQNSGLDLGFDIQLKITNPNAVPLPIKGMNYALSLNGAQLMRGTSGQVPRIPAYGSETVGLSISTNILSAPKFLVSLLSGKNQELNYELTGTLDLEGMLPSLSISESGKVPLR